MDMKNYLIKLTKKKKRRLGVAAGGKTCGRGTKGQKARKSGHVRPGFEGGQTPIYRRLPKVGPASNFKSEFCLINLEKLEKDQKILSGQSLDFSQAKKPVKVLGMGKLTKKLIIKAAAFSKSAKKEIEQAGGQIKVISKDEK
jgi:large subunit ribosomal protein L15